MGNGNGKVFTRIAIFAVSVASIVGLASLSLPSPKPSEKASEGISETNIPIDYNLGYDPQIRKAMTEACESPSVSPELYSKEQCLSDAHYFSQFCSTEMLKCPPSFRLTQKELREQMKDWL